MRVCVSLVCAGTCQTLVHMGSLDCRRNTNIPAEHLPNAMKRNVSTRYTSTHAHHTDTLTHTHAYIAVAAVTMH